MIPDEAVEAAARAIFESRSRMEWNEMNELFRGAKESTRKEARAALEAAAPHLMAAAWERGQADLTHDLFRDQELAKKGARLATDDATPNPYRKPTDA